MQQQQQQQQQQPEEIIDMFLDSLTPHQKKAFQIAKEHLGTSFDIQRSNGFQEWKKSQKPK